MNEFVTVQNLQHCEGRFKAYVETHHGIRLDGEASGVQLRQLLFRTMVDVRERSAASLSGQQQQAITLKTLNNATLNAALGAMLSRGESAEGGEGGGKPGQPGQRGAKSGQARAAAAGSSGSSETTLLLSRETDVYGPRQVQINELQPMTTDRRADITDRVLASHDRAVGERGGPPLLPPTVVGGGVAVGAMDTAEFERRLAELARGRGDVGEPPMPPMDDTPLMTKASRKEGAPPQSQSQSPPPPARSHAPDNLEIERSARRDVDAWAADRARAQSHAYENRYQEADLLIPAPSADHIRVETRYLTIDGSDRNFLAEPLRYRFTARTGGLQTGSSLVRNYHNIAWLEATRVVLPMEIVSATGSVIMPKGYYNIDYSFAFPYLILLLDDFDNVMDGTNELLRRAFCVFVYDQDYKAPNGRGYVMLKPAQQERKAFNTPMGSLRDLSVSLVRPNGVLFNSSRDDLTSSSLQYEPQNHLLIKVVCSQFFDRNDVWPGDMVRLSGFAMEVVAVGPVGPMVATGIVELASFLNRGEGHEVIQLGATNSQGFVNAFYVLASARFDSLNGGVVVDQGPIAAINGLGAGPTDPTATTRVTSPARLMNMSLQAVLTMRVGCITAVPSALHPRQVLAAADEKNKKKPFMGASADPAPAPAPAPTSSSSSGF